MRIIYDAQRCNSPGDYWYAPRLNRVTRRAGSRLTGSGPRYSSRDRFIENVDLLSGKLVRATVLLSVPQNAISVELGVNELLSPDLPIGHFELYTMLLTQLP